MWETGKSIILSKTVWTAVGGVVLAIANLLGWQIGDTQVSQAIDLLLFVLTAVFRFMATQPLHVVPPADTAPPAPTIPDHLKGV